MPKGYAPYMIGRTTLMGIFNFFQPIGIYKPMLQHFSLWSKSCSHCQVLKLDNVQLNARVCVRTTSVILNENIFPIRILASLRKNIFIFS